jgi:hypothetical protein
LGGDFGNIVRPVNLPPTFLILALLAVGLHLRFEMAVLLSFDLSQCVAQALVLDDGGVTDPLILAEDAVSDGMRPIRLMLDSGTNASFLYNALKT